MKTFTIACRRSIVEKSHRALALVAVSTLLVGMLLPVASAEDQKTKPQRLTVDQKIVHALNRLGFGIRPGDVERVRAIGLDKYIEQQLFPDRIQDSTADAKVNPLSVLSMTTPELYAKFPNPAQLLRRLENRGDLPENLAKLRDERAKGGANATPNPSPQGAMPSQPKGQEAMPGPPTQNPNPLAGVPQDPNNAQYREAVRKFYQDNGLEQPGRISAELNASRILRAVYSERQLNEVMVDFWSNHFNIFVEKGADRWLLVSYDRDTIRPNVFGKFRDMLQATAESPAMLFYLDNFESVSPNAQQQRPNLQQQLRRNPLLGAVINGRARDRRTATNPAIGNQPNMGQQNAQRPNVPNPPQQQRRGLNENYARELMELHTLGVDGGYTQKDVQEVARCFTGWTIFDPRGAGAMMNTNLAGNAGKFFFNPRVHDDGEKVVLGQKIPAGGGMKDGMMVLDILSKHPSTAKFIATKLARKFVMDEPTPALVGRIAGAFTKSDGDIRETLRAMFTSPEFESPEAYRAKIKTPFELMVSAVRSLGGETNGLQINQWLVRMGEPLYGYQAPTGYPDVAENWVNTGALLERLNFGLALASNRIPGTRVNLNRFTASATSISAQDTSKAMDRFLDVILQGEVSEKTKQTLVRQMAEPLPPPTAQQQEQMQPPPNMGGPGQRGAQRPPAQISFAPASGSAEMVKLVGLILGSPEFQRQ